LLTENIVHWKHVPLTQRLHKCTLGWWESLHLSSSYLKEFNCDGSWQPGGTSVWSINSSAHRVMESGNDPLGR
jgi:hypothetical protein